jgi:predicted permease
MSAVLRFAVELVPALAVGLVLGRLRPGLPARLAPPLVHWGVPLSMVGLLLRAGLQRDLALAAAIGALVSGGGLLLIRLLPPLARLLGPGTLQLGSVVGNTAYWGLPAALALLPPSTLSHVIGYDLAGTLVTWSVGPLLVEGVAARPRAVLAALLASPASRGLGLAVALACTPWSQPLASLLWWPARAVLLLALVLVGMRLGLLLAAPTPEQTRTRPPAQGLALALTSKLLLLPALLYGLASLLPLPLPVGQAVVLQAAAPTAISVLLIGEAAQSRGRSGEAGPAAALVLGSTLAALITVPLWGLVLKTLPAG